MVGLARAKQIALFGEPLPAATAAEWGLINLCVPTSELLETAGSWARKLATLDAPAGGPRMGESGRDLSYRVGHIKSQLNMAMESTMYQTFREEATLLSLGEGHPPE
jgi:2-(1,2-epoxy-1,2-dihydrophenyl)acetyl-CoA isomerase